MTLRFFAIIDDEIDIGYKVILNSKNINFLPTESERTLRRIATDLTFNKGEIIYVSGASLDKENTSTVRVSTCYKLSKVEVTVPEKKVTISNVLAKKILSSDLYPIHMYKDIDG